MSLLKLESECLDDSPMKDFHKLIFSNLTSFNRKTSRNMILKKFTKEFSHIEDLLVRTCTLGESNSALIVSPRGNGKSLILNAILSKLEEGSFLNAGIIVKLSGLFQTDDRLALRLITQQLQLNEEYASKFSSFAENLSFILKSLELGNQAKPKPIVFILDEFDLFCHHRNQTLLYNLFDVSQSAQTPICVIGLTCRLDVIELFEKRVKSRFSHRQIFLLPDEDFEEYYSIAKSFFEVESPLLPKKQIELWASKVEQCFQASETRNILKLRFSLSKDLQSLKNFLHFVLSELNDKDPYPAPVHFKNALHISSYDSKANIIQGLSILQLCLVVAMKHLHRIYEGEPFNFQMVYNEYKKFSSRHMSAQSFEKSVVLKAFDQLQCLEIICSVDQNRHAIQKEYKLMQLMILPSTLGELLSNMTCIPAYLAQWNSSSLD